MTLLSDDVQTAHLGELVTLFELDCTNFADGTVLRFTSTAYSTSQITWNGNEYLAIDIEADGFEYTGNGAFPTPTLRLSNVNQVATALVLAYEDLIGATLTRIRTLRQYLDDGVTPDPTQIFIPDIYTVEQKSKHTRTSIEWKLSASIDQQGAKIPGFTLVRDYCSRLYRRWDPVTSSFDYRHATCRYNDVGMFKADNTVTTNGAEDTCAKTITACKLRFGATNPLQFKGCPGMSKLR